MHFEKNGSKDKKQKLEVKHILRNRNVNDKY